MWNCCRMACVYRSLCKWPRWRPGMVWGWQAHRLRSTSTFHVIKTPPTSWVKYGFPLEFAILRFLNIFYIVAGYLCFSFCGCFATVNCGVCLGLTLSGLAPESRICLSVYLGGVPRTCPGSEEVSWKKKASSERVLKVTSSCPPGIGHSSKE